MDWETRGHGRRPENLDNGLNRSALVPQVVVLSKRVLKSMAFFCYCVVLFVCLASELANAIPAGGLESWLTSLNGSKHTKVDSTLIGTQHNNLYICSLKAKFLEGNVTDNKNIIECMSKAKTDSLKWSPKVSQGQKPKNMRLCAAAVLVPPVSTESDLWPTVEEKFMLSLCGCFKSCY